ncbi:MAG: hypothetical protein DRJ30_04085 [Candidatus Methanomethylicota archaeon]|nr:MAG: hypothetical protein DRJ30_04085 [Candidatus Verstraetearchaeota archaeon]
MKLVKLNIEEIKRSLLNPKLKTIILTHSDMDGIASAAILIRYLKLHRGLDYDEIKVLFVGPSTLLNALQLVKKSNCGIYITDISINERHRRGIINELKRLKRNGNRIYWIDHHHWREETVKEIEKIIDWITVKKTPSAARIVYMALNSSDEVSGRIADYADDIDSLTDRLEESFTLRVLSFKNEWREKLLRKFSEGVIVNGEVREEGVKIRRLIDREVEKALKKAKIMWTKGKRKFAFIDLREAKLPKSWLARKVAEKYNLDFTMVLRKSNAISLYIGSKKNSEINLLPIAKHYGGGGHTFACGFKLKLSLKSKILNYLTFGRYISGEVKEAVELAKLKL